LKFEINLPKIGNFVKLIFEELAKKITANGSRLCEVADF
jgi:hypothetical protein